MRIKKFESFNKPNLKYWAMDFDDNILHMPTVIHMDKKEGDEWVPVDVSTAEFATVRNDKENYRIRNNNPSEAFSEFRDTGSRGDKAFIEDTKKALDNGLYGPSWDAFIDCLINANIFAIITARGHEPETLKKGVEYIIDNELTDDEKHEMYAHCLKFAYIFNKGYDSYDRIPKNKVFSQNRLIQDYLNYCDYFGVSAPSFSERFGLGDASNPEKAKEIALKHFAEKAHEFGKEIGSKKISLGFSDDDIRNVEHIEKVFRNELSLKYLINYTIINTSDRNIKGGVKTKIPIVESTTSFGSGVNTWGTDSSILSFNKWNNMTRKLYPNGDNPKDDRFNNLINDTKSANSLHVENCKCDEIESTNGCICGDECNCGPECICCYKVPDIIDEIMLAKYDSVTPSGYQSQFESNWIKDAIKNKGSLRKSLGKNKGDKISKTEIDSELLKLKSKDRNINKKGLQLSKGDERKRKRLTLAKTLKGFK